MAPEEKAGEEIKEAKEFNLGKESLKILEKIDYFTLLLWDKFLKPSLPNGSQALIKVGQELVLPD